MGRLGRPDRVLQNTEHPAQAGHGGLRLIEHLGELGDRLEEPIRQEDEADQRARREPCAGAADDSDGHNSCHREHAEHLARGEQERTDRAGADERVRALVAGPFRDVCVVRAGVIGTQRLGAGDHLTDRREHLGVACSGLVVGGDEVTLHAAQHERQRRSGGERHEREHPVVGQHHAGDHHHQRAIEQPGQGTPREELRERLDVAGDTGDQRSPSFLTVIGDAQPVDVLEESHPQSVERFFTSSTETSDRSALRKRGDDDDRQADHAEDRHVADVDVVLAKPMVDGLLHEDRHDHTPRGSDHRQPERGADAAAQVRAPLRRPCRSSAPPTNG